MAPEVSTTGRYTPSPPPTAGGPPVPDVDSTMPSNPKDPEKRDSHGSNHHLLSGGHDLHLPIHQGEVTMGGGEDGGAGGGVGGRPQPRRWHSRLIRPGGESGRSGFHPLPFFHVIFRSASPVSKAVNVLWPVVPVAIAVRYALPHNFLLIFVLAYIAMVPCANLIGAAGHEFSRKVPHVFGVLTETTLGSLVEIILFMVMITRPNTEGTDYIQVIKSAILGSILATMLLCLGLCFIAGGVKRREQEFSEAVSEAGSGLLLVAGFGLAIPTVFEQALFGVVQDNADLTRRTMDISRSTAVLLMVAYLVFVFFQARTHHGIYDAIFRADEARGDDGAAEPVGKLTLTECVVALSVSVALVAVLSIALVDQIPLMVEQRGVSDAFMGLILVPLVEKAAEHLTAIDEAYDSQMNFALSHVLGATLQTALFNGPLVVVVGWGMGRDMGLNFEIFDMAMLILAIVTVGNFLRDQKSNYLEGTLCVIVYVGIAVAAAYYPQVKGGALAASEAAEAAKIPHVVGRLLRTHDS